jgi:hypothetical protein
MRPSYLRLTMNRYDQCGLARNPEAVESRKTAPSRLFAFARCALSPQSQGVAVGLLGHRSGSDSQILSDRVMGKGQRS